MTTEKTPVPETPETGPDWTVLDIGSIIVSLSGAVFTLLPWGVFQTRLEAVDILLMLTPVFIFVSAVLAYAGTVLREKTNGRRSRGTALIARILIWGSIAGLLGPIIFRFITLAFAG